VVDLDALAEAALACGAPGVIVARREGGETVFGAAGAGDVESGTRVDPMNAFYAGSVGKTFLAALVLELVRDSGLDLDGPADAYLDEALGQDIRLRHLLQHTSGLPDFYAAPEFLARWIEDPGYRWAVEDLLELALRGPREPPGAWSYSNTNFLLLWLVVEHVAGSPRTLWQRLAAPLGLHGTELGGLPADGAVARGYMPAENPFRPAASGLVDATDLTTLAYPGATVSTADDIARFLEALLDGTLLTPELRRELLTTVATDWAESDAYGLGIERITSFYGTSPSTCGPAWGHLGLAPGCTTIALSREDGSGQVVLMANMGFIAGHAWQPLAEAVWGAFCGGESADGQR
jgi:D-alanyl-D-alanine carboxypeptidase